MSFVHLCVHSEYSVVKGIVRLNQLIERTKALGMTAVALTDHVNMFAAIKFFNAARAQGIKPIFGCELWIQWEGDLQPSRTIIWCQNNQGYQNISILISKAYLLGANQNNQWVLPESSLTPELAEGLFACVGGQGCQLRTQVIQQSTNTLKLKINQMKRYFPDRLLMGVCALGFETEHHENEELVALAATETIPVVALNDVCFLKEEDFEAHEARICIEQGRVLADASRPKNFTREQYFKSPEAMRSCFEQWPDVIENTERLAQCCNVWFEFSEHFLPDFPIESGLSLEAHFRQTAHSGLTQRLKALTHRDDHLSDSTYFERLDIECDTIIKMGFCGYFLIVSDFIAWAKSSGIPVGPGRGSGAGSLVAYVLNITDIDPLAYDLLFERFLNPERVSMPDFDIDFCMEGRDRVIEYVSERYGRDNVSQIITFGTMAARAVVRDVGRVLSHPYGFVDQLAKLVPMDLGMTLSRAMEQEPLLLERYQSSSEVAELIDLALKLEGVIRGVGKHAGGVVIAPRPLQTFTPIYCETPESSLVSQFDKDDIESIGLVKFDFLGLKTLTIIDWTVQMIRSNHPEVENFDINTIRLDDETAFKLLQSGQTTAVFQLESRGMKDLIIRLQPDSFEEIVALVALFRPGPLQAGMVDDYIDRKHGRKAVTYPDPCLVDILKPTYGVILYQEQVMQIAQVFSGYTLGGADLLRRAMGKKKIEAMAKQRAIFVEGAVSRGHEATLATQLFDLIEKFAGYGFNKSHSVAYALLSYQTLFLKAHYPSEFMACALSADMDHTDKVLRLVQATQSLGIKVLPPNVNASQYRFSVERKGVLIYGLGAIKGLGQQVSEDIVKMRKDRPYQDLSDLIHRLNEVKVNRKTLECLVRSGALDSIIPHRASAFASIDMALAQADQFKRDAAQGQTSLFDVISPVGEASIQGFNYVQVKPWREWHQLKEEKIALGLYLTGHPISSLRTAVSSVGVIPIDAVKTQEQYVIGLVTGLRVMQGRRGQSMGFATIEDETGSLDVALFRDAFHHFRAHMVVDQCVMVKGVVSQDALGQGLRMQADWVTPWSTYLESHVQQLKITLDQSHITTETLNRLKSAFKVAEMGPTRVVFLYHQPQASAQVDAGQAWQVTVSDALLEQLMDIEGVLDTAIVLSPHPIKITDA